MREILFRGRRRNGEWIEGNYIFWNKKHCIYDGIYYEVLPETISEFTSLYDKNGKKIFEGDILAFSDRLTYVFWNRHCGCWDCSYIKAIDGKETSHEERNPNEWRFVTEIVGNIHDNPELLKGGAE